MIPIKIQCGCGQRYAFDIVPVDGRMPHAVTCPVCAADGTATANAIIAQTVPAAPPAAPRPAVGVRLRATVPAAVAEIEPPAETAPAAPLPSGRPTTRPGQLDRAQAEHEARAKTFWGDATEEVTKFLMLHDYKYDEASTLARALFLERAKVIRANGVRKILLGSGLICVPLAALALFAHMKFFPAKLFGLTVMIGLWGA